MQTSGLAFALVLLGACAVHADERIAIVGSAIRYNGSVAGDGVEADANVIRELTRANPNVAKIVLTGAFHMTGYVLDVAHAVEELGLTTEIVGECTDACIYLFVAGKERVLGDGAKLGLRRRVVDVGYLRDVYPEQALQYGWADEFGQAAMMYDRGQSDMRWALLHLVEHRVTLDFALRIFATPREDMWWPDRDALVEGGVIGNLSTDHP
jgi:hypothetical protein